VIDPLGGIWTMWPLFGTANQMLAAIALILCTVVLFKMKRERLAWVTIVPTVWLVLCTVTAGVEKVFSPEPAVGFIAHAMRFGDAAAAGRILAPAKTLHEMSRIIFNDYLDAGLAGLFATIVVTMVIYGILDARKALGNSKNTTAEIAGAMAGAGDD
jgi:carbon starvation protein